MVEHAIDAEATVAALDTIVASRGCHPEFVRCDNGPELTANALRDWCRFTGAGASYIEPGSPWQNQWVESYGSRIRDELLAIEQFDTLLERPKPSSATGRPSTTPTAASRFWGSHPSSSRIAEGRQTNHSSRNG